MSKPGERPSWYESRLARLLGALTTGCTLAYLPRITSNLSESGIVGSLKFAIQCLMLPGAAVSLIASRNAHDVNIWVIEATDVVFYSGLLYAGLTARARRKDRL